MGWAAYAFGATFFVLALRECHTFGRILLTSMLLLSILLPRIYTGASTGPLATFIFVAVCIGSFFYVKLEEIKSKLWW